jgi:hypothetical protein
MTEDVRRARRSFNGELPATGGHSHRSRVDVPKRDGVVLTTRSCPSNSALPISLRSLQICDVGAAERLHGAPRTRSSARQVDWIAHWCNSAREAGT